MSTPEIRVQTRIAMALGGCLTLIIPLLMHRDYPWVGHDYAYFIPRLLDTSLHIHLNGYTIQWFTPSFGGGLPAYPNPQHIQYSIVQVLSLWIDPWSAILISTAAITLVGFYFCYKFIQEQLGLSWKSSALGALFFIANGFYIEHLIAGQMGYQLFPLFSVVLYVLIEIKHHPVRNGAISAILLSLMIHQAGFYLIVILALSVGMTLPLLHFYRHHILDLRKIGFATVTAATLFALLNASKIYATLSFMQYFPRDFSDTFDVGLTGAWVGLFAQFLGVMLLQPILLLARQNPEYLSGALSHITGSPYGLWETDTGLSPVLILFLLGGLASAITQLRRNLPLQPRRLFNPTWLFLLIPIWITIEMTLARGPIYSVTKQLPVLSSLHINHRFAAAFILPLIVIGVFQLERFFKTNTKSMYFYGLALLTLLLTLSYFSLPASVHMRDHDVTASNSIHRKILARDTLRVTEIRDFDPMIGFVEGASSLKPYEPLFGYWIEEFNASIQPGDVFQVENGYFNMTNPSSLVFPEENGTYPFERIKVSEQDKLEHFISRGQPDWKIPAIQKSLNVLAAFSLLITIVAIAIPSLRHQSQKIKETL